MSINKWKRYTNPDGSLGGYVGPGAVVEEGSFIGPRNIIYPDSQVTRDQKLEQSDWVIADKVVKPSSARIVSIERENSLGYMGRVCLEIIVRPFQAITASARNQRVR